MVLTKYPYLTVLVICLACIVFFSACKEDNARKQNQSQKNTKEALMKVNKGLVKNEEQQIEDFLNRYNWTMQETGTGLRYMIYEKGEGIKAEPGKTALLDFTVSLLNGEVCYSSDESGPKEFVIGKSGVESGLQEGILLLKEGDRAKFIIPSHLAFGLLGDQDRIPARSTLIYDVKLLKIK
jgi:gliding motility-associated peptidyl-prolyl isomerase